MYATELDDLLNDAENTPAGPRNLRPRNSSGRARVANRVRTRLFERIRQTVLFQMIRSHRLLRQMVEEQDLEESSVDLFNSSEDVRFEKEKLVPKSQGGWILRGRGNKGLMQKSSLLA